MLQANMAPWPSFFGVFFAGAMIFSLIASLQNRRRRANPVKEMRKQRPSKRRD